MADGDIILLDNHKFSVKLFDAQAAATSSPWVEVPPQYSIWAFHTSGQGTDTIAIQVSNAIAKPSSATAGGVLGFSQGTTYATTLTGADGTATQVGWVDGVAFRWVRAVKTGTAGTSTLILEADSNQ